MARQESDTVHSTIPLFQTPRTPNPKRPCDSVTQRPFNHRPNDLIAARIGRTAPREHLERIKGSSYLPTSTSCQCQCQPSSAILELHRMNVATTEVP